MSVSRNGVYKIYDQMHVAFPRIIPRIMPPNHTSESYHESYPLFEQGRAKHTPETYLRNIPRIIPPDATRFAGHGVFGKGHIMLINFFIYIYIYIYLSYTYIYGWLRKGMLVVQTPRARPRNGLQHLQQRQRRPSWKARKLCWWSGRRPMYEVPRGEVFWWLKFWVFPKIGIPPKWMVL